MRHIFGTPCVVGSDKRPLRVSIAFKAVVGGWANACDKQTFETQIKAATRPFHKTNLSINVTFFHPDIHLIPTMV